MARLIRKQFYITEEQERLLKARAQEQARSEAELVREGLDAVLRPADERARRKAWAAFDAFLRKRSQIAVPQTERTWTRDELYDERPKYLSR